MSFISPVANGPAPAPVLSRCSVSCTIYSDAGELERLALAWEALLTRSACNEPVLSPLWMLNWWQVFGSLHGRQLCVACFLDGERLVGLAPLLRRRSWYRRGLPFRRLEPVGTGEKPADAIHPEYLSVISERGAEETVACALASVLVQGAFGSWDELLLPRMDATDLMLAPLTKALRDLGLTCHCQAAGSAPYIPLPGTWEVYLQQLSASRRSYLRKSLHQFEHWAGSDISLHAVTTHAELAEGRRILTALHQERWGGAGKFGSQHFAAFHDRVMPALLDARALELLWLSVRGEPVAVDYNIVWNGKVYFYQGGRKLNLPAGLRPGIVLHAHAIRRAIEEGRREYDFLGGGENYKERLALAARPLVDLRVSRASLREHARSFTERAINRARALRNSIRAAGRRLFRSPSRGKTPPLQ